ncbi:MAG: hypothetical protein ACYC69_17200 [Thermodesulfovibrionales bacterium]
MAVLIEAVSVIVRIAAIRDKMADGWTGFERVVPNATLCFDDDLARVGFMEAQEAEAFIGLLTGLGLTFLREGKPVDIAIADQRQGLTTECTWLMFSHLAIDKAGARAAVCWLTSEKRLPVPGIHMPLGWKPGDDIKLATPEGWRYEESLSNTSSKES